VDHPLRPDPSAATPTARAVSRSGYIDLVAIALLAGLFVYWRLSSHGTAQRKTGAEIVLAVAALAATWFAVGAVRRTFGPPRLAWLAIGTGCASWAGGAILFARNAHEAGLSGRFIPLHLGWIGLAAALAAGILLLGVPNSGPEGRRKLVLDLIPTVIALIAVVWLAVFGPSAIDGSAPWRLRLASASHGGGALVLMVVALAGALRPCRSHDRRVVWKLSFAAAILAVADLVWLQPWMGGRTDRSLFAQVGLLIGFLAVMIAALRMPRSEVDAPAIEDAEPAAVGGDWLQFVPHFSLLGLLLLAWGQSRLVELQPHGTETAIVGSLAVVVFVMLRQGFALRHERTLKGEIGHLTAQVDGLIRQVGRDPLTGLLNRRAVLGRIEHELSHGRTFGHPVTVVLIDVDNFKTINDTLGHQAGDRVLVAVGSILNAACRGTDVAARYAGDEFLLVLPGLNETVAGQVCDRIVEDVRRLSEELALGGIRVTLSVGAAVTHRCKRTATQVIAIADAAMYDAKESGKDRTVAVNADTLLPPGISPADVDASRTDLTYLPSPVVRALGERRRRALAERAS
jgi:diguanylate cyclase (GGDEF)-like protein